MGSSVRYAEILFRDHRNERGVQTSGVADYLFSADLRVITLCSSFEASLIVSLNIYSMLCKFISVDILAQSDARKNLESGILLAHYCDL